MATQHFPLFSRPVGPMWASSEARLRRAAPIRGRVLRRLLDEANACAEAAGVGGEAYDGYVRRRYLLRTRLDADWWLRWAATGDDTGPVVAAPTADYPPAVLGGIPADEALLYREEQRLIQEQRADPGLGRRQWGLPQSLY